MPMPDKPTRPTGARRSWQRRRRRRWFGWSLVVLGVRLFLYGYIGAATGLISLPFDRHHVASQIAGAVVAVLGLRWATSE